MKLCIWQNGTLNGVPIRYEIIDGKAIFEGNMILTPEQLALWKAQWPQQRRGLFGEEQTLA